MEDDAPRGGGGRPNSTTRVYVGNLPPNVQKSEVESHFNQHGTGKIVDMKLMTGFGFLEYEDPLDARDVVPSMHGTEFAGQRLTVQFARGPRDRDTRGPTGPNYYGDRTAPRTRRTIYRMTMSGLPGDTSWQDLKDFARLEGLDVVYSEIPRERDGTGFVEYETEDDLNNAVAKADGREFRGTSIQCTAAIQSERPRDNRHRSRSPPPYRRGYGGAPAPRDGGYHDDHYDRRGPPRSYSTRGYRDRSPPPRRDYHESRSYQRSPPPGRSSRGPPPPMDDYQPRRSEGRYADQDYAAPARGYGGRGPPPAYAEEPYSNGARGGSGGGPPSPGAPPPRRRSPGPPRGGGDYDRGYGGRSGY